MHRLLSKTELATFVADSLGLELSDIPTLAKVSMVDLQRILQRTEHEKTSSVSRQVGSNQEISEQTHQASSRCRCQGSQRKALSRIGAPPVD